MLLMIEPPSSRAVRGLAFALALASATALAPAAQAQTAADKAAAAQALFDLAQQLVAAGRLTEACPKLEESQRLDPGMGTQFRLAECYEKLGKTASAWAMYAEVADTARLARLPEREIVAKKRADALAATLSRLTVVVSPAVASIAGLEVVRDGVPLGRPLWGTPLPVDPGDHLVSAKAPGRKTWQGRGVAGPAGAQVEIAIPPLEDLPGLAAVPPARTARTTRTARSPVPAILLGGLGAVGLGAGVALLVVHAGKRGDAEALSAQIKGAHHSCVPRAANLDAQCGALASRTSASDNAGNASTVALAIGGAGAAAMLTYLLWPTAAAAPSAAIRLTPVLGADHQGLVATGSF